MMKTINGITKNVCLVILDGYGISENRHRNAIFDAAPKRINYYFENYPFTTLEAGGISVGLPKGVAGNSEVGHMNIGAGRPVRQDLVRINEAIENNNFHTREKFQELISHAKNNNNRIHLMGLLSDGSVHSHIDHLKVIVKYLLKENINIFFHAFMDGRDTAPRSGKEYLEQLQKIDGLTMASMQGRSIGMDRDRRWEKTQACYDLFLGQGKFTEQDPIAYLEGEYQAGRGDEFINPVMFAPEYAMSGQDSVFFINFRPDRAIQLSLAFTEPKFSHFKRSWTPSYFLCMTPYIDEEVELPILFDKESIKGTLSEYLSEKRVKQFKIAETEKYAHITFFFNGGRRKPFSQEDQCLVPSPKDIPTYDKRPEMSAFEVTEKLTYALEKNEHSFYLVNFANSDMVGHTGNYSAALEAIKALDRCIDQIAEVCLKNDIALLITADHGNSDQMEYDSGEPHTSHTNSPVPFCLVHPNFKNEKLELSGNTPYALKDIAPTIISIMGIEKPKLFSGVSVFK